MRAPTTVTVRAAEQPTRPLPISRRPLPGGGNWLMSEGSVLLIPGTVLAAVGVGVLLRNFAFLTEVARSNFAIVALLAVFALSLIVMICGHLLNRRDGRGR